MYNDLPSYRTILDREGNATVADAALIGDEDPVGEQLAELAAAGVTDFASRVVRTLSRGLRRAGEPTSSASRPRASG